MVTIARYGSDDVGFLLIDGYDLLGTTTQLEHAVEAMTEETTALGDSATEHTYTGIQRATLTQQGFYDDAAAAQNAAFAANIGTAPVLCFGIEGNTIGEKFIGYSGAMQATWERVASRGQLHKANARYEGSGIVEEGEILHAHGAETSASGNTEATPVDGGAGNAPSTDGGSGYLQVSALTLGGYTDVTIKVRDSDDDITYGDLLTFTAVTTAQTAERVTVAGNVERYVASSYAFTGAGTGQSVTYFCGFYRN